MNKDHITVERLLVGLCQTRAHVHGKRCDPSQQYSPQPRHSPTKGEEDLGTVISQIVAREDYP